MIGSNWDGAREHAGHVVTVVETWDARIDADHVLSAGTLRCSCGDEWRLSAYPSEGVRPAGALT